MSEEGDATRTTTNPISDDPPASTSKSRDPGRSAAGSPTASPKGRWKKVTIEGDLRVDSGSPAIVCATVYYEDSQDRERVCGNFPTADHQVVPVKLVKNANDRRISRVIFQFPATNRTWSTSPSTTSTPWSNRSATATARAAAAVVGEAAEAAAGRAATDEEPYPNGPPDPYSPCDFNRTPPVDPDRAYRRKRSCSRPSARLSRSPATTPCRRTPRSSSSSSRPSTPACRARRPARPTR